MKVEEAIERVQQLGFGWKRAVINNKDYLVVLYEGVEIASYPIKNDKVYLEPEPYISERFKKLVSELCDKEPVYYDNEWWIIAQCDEIEISTILGRRSNDVEIHSLSTALPEDIVEKLIGIKIPNVKYIFDNNGDIIIGFNDGDYFQLIKGEEGGNGLLNVPNITIEKIKSMLNTLEWIKKLLPQAEISGSDHGFVVRVNDEIIELPPSYDYIFKQVKKYSKLIGSDVKVIPGSFVVSRPQKFFVIDNDYVCCVHGEENLEKYKKIREVVGGFGGVIRDDGVEIMNKKITIINNEYVSFNDYSAMKKLSKIIKLPDKVKEIIERH